MLSPSNLIKTIATLSILALMPLTIKAQERGDVPPFRNFGCSAAQVSHLDTLTQRFRTLWGAQDTAALMALHAEDTEWINAYGRQFQDKAALGPFLEKRLFPTFGPSVSQTEAANMQTVSYRCLGKTAAIIHLYAEGNRGESRNAGEDKRRTHTHLVLEKQKGDWRIVHTAVMDVRKDIR